MLALVAMATLLQGLVLTARADATIVSATVENAFPKQLNFKLTAQSASDITDVTLAYEITGRGTSALGKPAEFTPGKTVSVEVVVQVNSGNSYIPVGSDFLYHWEITTADGTRTKGPDTKFFFLPPNITWQSVSGDIMTVYYHGDRQALANAYLKAGLDTYEKIGKSLFNTTLKQTPVKVILFENEAEMGPARPGTVGRFQEAVLTCGTKVTNDIVLVIPLSCGTADRTDTLRHEFGHILNQTAGEGPLGKLPSWLDEGTAVYAQSAPGDGYAGAFQSAVRANRLLPFNQMGNVSNDPNLVNLFYGQSYFMVKYLVDKAGPAKYAEFFATIKKGSRFDAALQQVYGFDVAGFEKEFTAAVGSRPQTPPTAAPTQRPQQAQATAVPTARPAAQTNTSSTDDGMDRTSLVIVGVALAFGLLAVFSFLLSMMMANNRTQAAAGGSPQDWSDKGPGGENKD